MCLNHLANTAILRHYLILNTDEVVCVFSITNKHLLKYLLVITNIINIF